MDLEGYRPVDIIIPIYNAYEELQLCVESIKKYTNLEKNRLILINDKSPDKRIEEYLEKVKEYNICILHNEENLGFSGTINRGIQLSQNDVLLLNSDTVVTKRWIEKIVNCAYSDASIATVTPLSNNATLCSVPEFCKENKLPEDMTIDDMAELVENASAKLYLSLPVAHGFCMFIKRSVIEEIGLFDAKTFERGYGEENDFCYRAIQAGYYHVMCDDTYIYHSGTSSFVSEEKQKYIEEHEKILTQRYPKEMENTHIHCIMNPNKEIFDNIKNYITLWKNRTNILLVIHSDFRKDASDNCGGTQFHVKDLMMGLRDIYNVFVAARDGKFLNLTAYTKNEEIRYRYFIDEKNLYPVFSDKTLKKLFGSILDTFKIQLVHVHHTEGLSLDIFYEAEKREIPIITTLHDYYYICPNIKMLDYNNKLCIGKEKKLVCEKCLRNSLKVNDTIDYLPIWRRRNKKILEKTNLIITPSQSAKEIVEIYFPELKDKIQIVEHGSDAYKVERKKEYIDNIIVSDGLSEYIEELRIIKGEVLYIRGWAFLHAYNMTECKIYVEARDSKENIKQLELNKIIREDVACGDKNKLLSGFSGYIPIEKLEEGTINIRILLKQKEDLVKTSGKFYCTIKEKGQQNKGKFNIAFIGGLSVAKGAKLAFDLIKHSSKEINWFIFGDIGFSELFELNQDNLIKTGTYNKENLDNMLHDCHIDLVCILPIWPETFCYTLSEAILCKIPVLVTEIGALKERMDKLRCGWTIKAEANYSEILEKIEYIHNNKKEYQKMKDAIENIKLRNIEEMITNYKEIYQHFISKKDKKIISTLEEKKYLLKKNIFYTNFSNKGIEQETYKTLEDAEKKLRKIEHSYIYHLVLKLSSINFPFKMKIRKFLYQIYKKKK